MKKLLLLLSFCFLFVISGGAELKTYTEDFTSGNIWSTATSPQKKAGTGTFTSSATKFVYKCSWKYSFYYYNNTAILIGNKKDSYIELPSFNGKLQSVELTTNTGSSAKVQIKVTDSSGNLVVESKTLSPAGGSFSFVIPTDKQVEGGIYRLVVANDNNAQITKIVFKVEETTAPATQVATPIITPADGSKVEYGSTVTVSSDEGTNLVVSCGNDPAEEVGSNTKEIRLPAENSGITTYTVKAYAVDPSGALSNSEVAKATYTLYNSKVANIDAFIKAADTENAKVFQNPVTAIYQNANYLYVKDDSGYLLIYGKIAQTYKNGDVIPAGFSGTYFSYKNLPELQNPSGFQASTENKGEVTPTDATIELVSACSLSEYISLKKVKYDGTNLTDGTNSIAATPLGVTLTSGKTYNVKAFVDFNNVKVVEAEELQYVSDLEISPAFGEIEIGKTIKISCETAEATLDGFLTVGETETELTAVAMPYTYTVKEEDFGKTIKVYAQASLEGYEPSSVLEGSYTVVAPAAEKPTFSLKDYDEVYIVDKEGNITNEKVVIKGTAGCSLSLTVNRTEVETVAASDAVPTIEYTFSGDPCEKFTLVAKTTNKYNVEAETTAHYIIASTSKLMGELTVDKTNLPPNQYQAFDPAVIAGGVFAGFAYKSNGFQMNPTKYPESEIVMTYSIGEIQAIEITFAGTNGRTLSVYGKNEPYAVGGGQLKEPATQGDLLTTFITDGKTVSYNIPWDYKYIGLKITDGGASSVLSLKVIWRTGVDGLDVSYDKVTEASLVSGKFSVLAAMNGINTTFARNEGVATVELGDDNNISLLKGQITVDEFEINGNQDSFTLCGGLGVIGAENNTRTYLAVDADNNVIRVQDNASAANFKLELENGQVLVKFDGGEYLAYNGTNFVKTATIGEGYTAVNIFVNGSGVSTGVEAVEIEDADAPVEYYNLQGVRVANPQNGLYIVRQGNKVSKQIIR